MNNNTNKLPPIGSHRPRVNDKIIQNPLLRTASRQEKLLQECQRTKESMVHPPSANQSKNVMQSLKSVSSTQNLVCTKLNTEPQFFGMIDPKSLQECESIPKVEPVSFPNVPDIKQHSGPVYHGGLFNPSQGVLVHENSMKNFNKGLDKKNTETDAIQDMIRARVTGKVFDSPTISTSTDPQVAIRFAPREPVNETVPSKVKEYIHSLYKNEEFGAKQSTLIGGTVNNKDVWIDLNIFTGTRSPEIINYMTEKAEKSIAEDVLGPKVGVVASCADVKGYPVDYNDPDVSNPDGKGGKINYRSEKEVVIPGGIAPEHIKDAVLVFGNYMDTDPNTPSHNNVIHRANPKADPKFAKVIEDQINSTKRRLKMDRLGKLEEWKSATRDLHNEQKIGNTLESIKTTLDTQELEIEVTKGKNGINSVTIPVLKNINGIGKWVGVSASVEDRDLKPGMYTLKINDNDLLENQKSLENIGKYLNIASHNSTIEYRANNIIEQFIENIDEPNHGLASVVPKAL
jgi:hypothetical protein